MRPQRQIRALIGGRRSWILMQLLTSYVPQEGGPAGFYERLGFVPAGELDQNGEVIVRLVLPWTR